MSLGTFGSFDNDSINFVALLNIRKHQLDRKNKHQIISTLYRPGLVRMTLGLQAGVYYTHLPLL